MAQSPNLRHGCIWLNLEINFIEPVGAERLLAKEFPQLQSILLCKYYLSKTITTLATRECRCYQQHSSLSSKNWLLVTASLFREKQHHWCGYGHDAQLQDEPTEEARLMYIFYYSDYNNIGSVGTKLLIKAELPLLQTLWMSNC